MKNMRKSLGQVTVCLRKIQGSFSCNFSSSPWGSCQEKQDHGNSDRKCGHILSCVSLLKRPNCITHPHRRFSFEPIINTDSFSLITTKKQCRCFITLMYYVTIIFNAQAHHFNLLLPWGNFCSALLYYQATKKLEVDLTHIQKTEEVLLSYFMAIYN